MKHLLLICFSILFTTTVSSQLIQWTDDVTYTIDCPDPVEENTISHTDENFEYSININSSFNAIPISGAIKRITKVKIRNSNGEVVSTTTQSHLLPVQNQTITLLTNQDLIGLEPGEEYSIDLSFCYEMVNNWAEQVHSITTIFNGNTNPPQQTNVKDGLFACTDTQQSIFCFKIKTCENIKTYQITIGNNDQLTMNVPLCNGIDANQYVWTFLDFETLETSFVGNTRTITAEPFKSGRYCVFVNTCHGCFYTDCYDFLDQPEPGCQLEPATGLTYSNSQFGKINFSWDPVKGATSYVVDIVFNDPDCCAFGGGEEQVLINTTTPSASLETNGLGISCFSWRVSAICEPLGGSVSEKQCGIGIGTPGKQQELDAIETSEKTSFSIFPNPTNSTSLLTIDNVFDKEIAINIYSLEGMLVSSKTVTIDTGENAIQTEIGIGLTNGIYLVQVNSENLNLTKKILIQK